MGIMLGDGGIAPYCVTITLSNMEVSYTLYVNKLIHQLFGVSTKIYKRKDVNAVDIVIQRKRLVDFCQEIGLVVGNKVRQQVVIPEWIKRNKKFSQACIRGLVDTDGCFFRHSYFINGKKYSYLKMAFTSASLPLVLSMREILTKSGFGVRISKNHKDLRIEDGKYVARYIKEIGSHNQKHLQKIKKWKKIRNVLK